MSERAKNAALFLAVLLVLDLTLAQAYDRLAPLWQPRGPERPLRTASALYHHDLVKNVDGWAHWGGPRYAFRTNNLGFRDDRVREVPLHSEATRVLMLGDSFTEGMGVSFPQTFAGILARELRAQDVEVLNAAVVSYSPAIYYRKAQYLIEQLRLDVDVLVVLIDISDVLDEAWLDRRGRARVGIGETTREPLVKRLKHAIWQNSLVLKLTSRLQLVIKRRLGEGGRAGLALDTEETTWDFDPRAYREYGERGLRWGAENMDRLLALARRHGIAVAVVVYPWPDEIFHRRLDSRQVTFWGAWAKRRGVRFINLFPRFITGGDPRATIRKYHVPFDVHWSPAGHRLVAQALLEDGLNELIAEARVRTAAARGGMAEARGGTAEPRGGTGRQ